MHGAVRVMHMGMLCSKWISNIITSSMLFFYKIVQIISRYPSPSWNMHGTQGKGCWLWVNWWNLKDVLDFSKEGRKAIWCGGSEAGHWLVYRQFTWSGHHKSKVFKEISIWSEQQDERSPTKSTVQRFSEKFALGCKFALRRIELEFVCPVQQLISMLLFQNGSFNLKFKYAATKWRIVALLTLTPALCPSGTPWSKQCLVGLRLAERILRSVK